MYLKPTDRKKRTYILFQLMKADRVKNQEIEQKNKEIYALLVNKTRELFGKIGLSLMQPKTIQPWLFQYRGKQRTLNEIKRYMEKHNLFLASFYQEFEKEARFVIACINARSIKISHTINGIRKFILNQIKKNSKIKE